MKYIVVLIDGMADEAIESLGNKTPLEYAEIPNMDQMSKVSELGMVHTIPSQMPPGSDVANLSIMGYDPKVYHTGRSPLEAANIGIDMRQDDVVFRCNLVTVSEEDDFESKRMIDHSASDISSEEARLLLMDLKAELENEKIHFHVGTSYRNIIIWHEGHTALTLTPPHDFLGQALAMHMPKGADWIDEMTRKSYAILKDHPVNLKRKQQGLNPANCIWIWGEGRKPLLDSFEEKYGLKGATISAVDLIKGIGRCAGMTALEVAGATGTIETDFTGKANACLNAFRHGYDFVYLHLEATDECSHQGNLSEKIKAVEIIDEKIVGYLKRYMDQMKEPYKMLILPDHPTPVRLRTHTDNPVPYMLFESLKPGVTSATGYNEKCCKAAGNNFVSGPDLMAHFIRNVK